MFTKGKDLTKPTMKQNVKAVFIFLDLGIHGNDLGQTLFVDESDMRNECFVDYPMDGIDIVVGSVLQATCQTDTHDSVSTLGQQKRSKPGEVPPTVEKDAFSYSFDPLAVIVPVSEGNVESRIGAETRWVNYRLLANLLAIANRSNSTCFYRQLLGWAEDSILFSGRIIPKGRHLGAW